MLRLLPVSTLLLMAAMFQGHPLQWTDAHTYMCHVGPTQYMSPFATHVGASRHLVLDDPRPTRAGIHTTPHHTTHYTHHTYTHTSHIQQN